MNITVVLLLGLVLFLTLLGLALFGIRIVLGEEASRRKAIAQALNGRPRREDGAYHWIQDGLPLTILMNKKARPSLVVELTSGLPATAIIPASSLAAGTVTVPDLTEVPQPARSDHRFFSRDVDTLEHFLSLGLSRHISSYLTLEFRLEPSGHLTVSPTTKYGVSEARDVHELIRVGLATAKVFGARPA